MARIKSGPYIKITSCYPPLPTWFLSGYWIAALMIMLESAGFPFPGETALLVAAAYAGTGHLSISKLIVVAAAAAIAGDAGGYWLGRSAGRALLRHYGRYLRLSEEKLQRVESFFHRHGPKTVFFGRFVSILEGSDFGVEG